MTIREAKKFGQAELEKSSPSASLDVNCLLENILQCDKTFLLLHSNDVLSKNVEADFISAIQKRKTGFPIAYITNRKEFYGYDFYVTPDVLIPKPDTEILVENAVGAILERVKKTLPEKNGFKESSRENAKEGFVEADFGRKMEICDMCTGSGCIGISVFLALREEFKSLGISEERLPNVTFVDISESALKIAKLNAERLLGRKPFCGQDVLVHEENSWNRKKSSHSTISSEVVLNDCTAQFRFVRSNLFENIPETFDFILANPPYIPSKLVDELLLDGRSEPRLALDGDMSSHLDFDINGTHQEAFSQNTTKLREGSHSCDGLGIIRKLIPQMKSHLNSGGIFFMETGEYNAEKAAQICRENGFHNIEAIRDLEGQFRVVRGILGKPHLFMAFTIDLLG